jgi:hypothetical protein
MTDERTALGLRAAMESYLREEARAASYRRSHPENGGADRAHPLQFDESGFPIRQAGPGIARRIGRLLNRF